MPTLTLATVITDAMSVVSEFGVYIIAGIALALVPRFISMGKRAVAGGKKS